MNHLKYIILRLTNLLVGFIPTMLMFLFPKNRKSIVFSSEFNRCFNHNSKYLFLYFLSQESDYEVKFVINEPEFLAKLQDKHGQHFISTNSIKGMLYALRAKTWITSSLETPVGGFFLAYDRNVIHLGHGAPIKNIGLGENYNSPFKSIYYFFQRTNFSYFFSTSEVFDQAWSECLGLPESSIIRSPQARNELMERSIAQCETKSILYAPTWRPFSETLLFPFDDFDLVNFQSYLEQRNWVVYLRLHPNFESEASSYTDFNNIKLLDKSQVDDINEKLNEFDLLITDYSSIYVDFLLTEKPIVFLPYDYSEYSSLVGFTLDYCSYSPGPKPTSFASFLSELDLLFDNDSYYRLERNKANHILNPIKENHVIDSYNAVVRLVEKSK